MHSRLPRGLTEHSENLSEHYLERLLRLSGYAGDGFAGGYDAHRLAALGIVGRLVPRGTGRAAGARHRPGQRHGPSARAWADRAGAVVGVEASREMREQAEAATSAENVHFVRAYSRRQVCSTGRPTSSNSSRSFHWMEAEPTSPRRRASSRPEASSPRTTTTGRRPSTGRSRLRSRRCCAAGLRRGGPRGQDVARRRGTSTESARAAGSAMCGACAPLARARQCRPHRGHGLSSSVRWL